MKNTDFKKRGSRLSIKPGSLDCRNVVFEAVETDVKKTVKIKTLEHQECQNVCSFLIAKDISTVEMLVLKLSRKSLKKTLRSRPYQGKSRPPGRLPEFS